jgi:hypothetical protein
VVLIETGEPGYDREMKLGWVAAIVCVACQDSGHAMLEARVEALDKQVSDLRKSVEVALVGAMTPSSAKPPDLADSPVIHNLWDVNEEHTLKLLRIEGYLDAAGYGATRGWWCDRQGICGRSRGECIKLLRLVLTVDGSRTPDSACVSVPKAWCRGESRLKCTASRCKDCVEVE